MRRYFTLFLVVVMMVTLVACSGESENNDSASASNDTEAVDTSTPEGAITDTLTSRIKDKYTYTDIDKIEINENLGTEDVDDDYIALVHLTWTQKNSGKTSKDVLSMYSEDLAAYCAENCANVQEIAVFWTVPYLDDANAKCSYERKDGGMFSMDEMWNSAFNE